MRLTIDTDQKTITVEGNVPLCELIDYLKKNVSGWKDYELTSKVEEVDRWYWGSAYSAYPIYPTFTPHHGDIPGHQITWVRTSLLAGLRIHPTSPAGT
jgi:hypothetical protein